MIACEEIIYMMINGLNANMTQGLIDMYTLSTSFSLMRRGAL